MHTDNAAIVQRFIDEVINHGRYEVCDEIVAEDFLELDPASAQQALDLGAERARLSRIHGYLTHYFI